MKNFQTMPIFVEIESEDMIAHAEMIESLTPMCAAINQEGSMLLCTPDTGHLYDIILLLFHHKVEYKLRATPANNTPEIL